MMGVEPAGQRAVRGQDELGVAHHEAAPRHVATLHPEPQLGMVVARHFRCGIVCYGFVAKRNARDDGFFDDAAPAMVDEPRVVISGDPDPVEPAREGGQKRARPIGQPARVFTAPMQPQIMYATPPQAPAATLLGKVTAGQLVDLVAQIFAALMPLPAAPVATADTSTDVGNLILYQGALAQYAKRDEQVRTLGNLVTKLLG